MSVVNKYLGKLSAEGKELLAKYRAEIDAKIGAAIAKKAQADGYSLVLVKGAVLYGGADITEDIKKAYEKGESLTEANIRKESKKPEEERRHIVFIDAEGTADP